MAQAFILPQAVSFMRAAMSCSTLEAQAVLSSDLKGLRTSRSRARRARATATRTKLWQSSQRHELMNGCQAGRSDFFETFLLDLHWAIVGQSRYYEQWFDADQWQWLQNETEAGEDDQCDGIETVDGKIIRTM